MNYGTFAGLFQSIHEFPQQTVTLQTTQDQTKDGKDSLTIPSLLSVSNIQAVQDGLQRTVQSISTSSVQTVNSTNYILSSPVISQSQLTFSTGNQLAPLHYITTPTSINSNEIQVAWNDTNRHGTLLNDQLKNQINVPIFSTLPHNSLHMNSQTVWPLKSISVDSVGTMTDPDPGSDFIELKPKRRIDYDNIDCSNINVGIQANALSQYLSRMPPQILPLSVQTFLKKNNVPYNVKVPSNNLLSEEVSAIGMGSVNITVLTADSKIKKSPSSIAKPKPTLISAADGSIKFGCGACDMQFANEILLQNHVLVTGHEPDRKFRCDECGACLKRKEHLEQHKKGHSDDRPFVCSLCWKGFKRSEHLKRHYATHSNLKCYVCEVCNKAFHRKDHLAKHEQTHVNRRLAEAYETILQSPNMSTAGSVASPSSSVDMKVNALHQSETDPS